MIIIELIKTLLNSYIELCNSDFFFKPFITFCISLYLFTHYMIYYYIRIKQKPFAANIIIGGFIIGCVVGEIIGLSLAWYKDNVYLPSLENSSNKNTDISPFLENVKSNVTESKPLTDEEVAKKNTNNTIKWFCIIYTAFFILYCDSGIN